MRCRLADAGRMLRGIETLLVGPRVFLPFEEEGLGLGIAVQVEGYADS